MSVKVKQNINLIYAISFLDLFAVGLTVPLFANHLRQLGASHFTVGLLNSFYSGLQIISGPIIGAWSDVKDRKSVLLITLFLCSINYFLLGLAKSIYLIFLLRFLLGILKHTQSLCKAALADFLTIKERLDAPGKSAAFGSVGFIVGPLLGGYISELNNGFYYVCLTTSISFVINIALTLQLSINDKSGELNNKNSVINGFKVELNKTITDLKNSETWISHWDLFLIRFLYGFSFTMYISNKSMYLKEYFDLSQRHIGYIISFLGLIGTVSAFLLNSINKFLYKNSKNLSKQLIHYFSLMSISIIALYLAPNIKVFVVILIPFTFFSTFIRIVSMQLILDESQKDNRGSLAGISNSIMSVARLVTPITSGLVNDFFGEHLSMIFAAIPCIIATIICNKKSKIK